MAKKLINFFIKLTLDKDKMKRSVVKVAFITL